MSETTSTHVFREARDLLLSLREDPERAAREFAWPVFGDRFNWATDWFDAIARGNPRTALWIVEEDGATPSTRWPAAPTRWRRGWPLRGWARATTCC